jgi:hypothetical protein
MRQVEMENGAYDFTDNHVDTLSCTQTVNTLFFPLFFDIYLQYLQYFREIYIDCSIRSAPFGMRHKSHEKSLTTVNSFQPGAR